MQVIVGDKVSFRDNQGNAYNGIVIKRNPKRAKVLVGYQQWDVPYRGLYPENQVPIFNRVNEIDARGIFRPGQRVKFSKPNGRDAGSYTGVIMKVNQKSVKVRTDCGMNWTVGPSYLTITSGI